MYVVLSGHLYSNHQCGTGTDIGVKAAGNLFLKRAEK